MDTGDKEYKERTTELLSNNSEEVLRLLLHYIQRSGSFAFDVIEITNHSRICSPLTFFLSFGALDINSEIQSRVFQCLLSWLRSGDIDISSLVTTQLFSLSFEALQSDKLLDIAVDVICEVIHETKEINEYLPAIQHIYSYLYPLRGDLIRYCKEDNEDRVRGYCRIFVEAGESYLPLVLKHTDAFRGIVEGIAECTAYHDLDIVPMTFNFWYQLALALSDPQYQDTKTKFEDVYDRIVDVILVHLRYPDELARWTGEERDEFRNFRHIMGDTLKDCCIVLGARTCLSKPYDILTRILGAAESAGGVEAVLAAWQDIEAAIFSLRAMGAEVPDTESEVMPQIMEMLGKLPDHPKIRYAATLVISRYSGWTKLHPQFIEYQLNFISVGFENEEVAAASALALKHLCRDCSEVLQRIDVFFYNKFLSQLLVSFLNQLHPFFLNVTKTLPTQDVFEVTEAVAHVIAAIPTAELFKALQLFCLPVAQRLHEIALLRKDASDKQTKEASGMYRGLIWLKGLQILTIFVALRPFIVRTPRTNHSLLTSRHPRYSSRPTAPLRHLCKRALARLRFAS
ncbi:armadillo-type protein [Endogone sp. FLAS-F59071]|nr:armadillo-type protein [Endogone sp. FLAS-F59071]|eukprot:RUS17967.1 armadillo-type protein [Endogone sp. FLAS-F59071]